MKAKLEGKGARGTLALLGCGKKGVLEVLKQTDITPFKIVFNEAKQIVEDKEGKRWYMSVLSYGRNWRVSDETTGVLAEGPLDVGQLRMFYEEKYQFFRAMLQGRKYVFKFTCDYDAYYRVSVDILKGKAGGYVDIYLNNERIAKDVNTYINSDELHLVTLKLGTRKLKKGRYANKIKIIPTRLSEGDKNRPSFMGFSFDLA